MFHFPKPEYPILAEQKLPWVKKMIAPHQVAMMTMVMMILRMNKKLISKHIKLQKRHGDLLCSHKELIDSYALLESSHEVMVKKIKDYQPHTCTCAPYSIDLSCATSC
jgi:hypothetical protein